MIRVKDHPGLRKDPRSGAVININRTEQQNARNRKAMRMKEKERIDNIESDLKEIKALLTQLVRKD